MEMRKEEADIDEDDFSYGDGLGVWGSKMKKAVTRTMMMRMAIATNSKYHNYR